MPPSQGLLVFMPWATLPEPVRVGAFRFVPAKIGSVGDVVGQEIGATAEQALRMYVDQGGKPIESCTIVLRAQHPDLWAIPQSRLGAVHAAANILALACLAEQRFFEGHFAPHMNATVFRVIGQNVSANTDGIGLFYAHRGGSLGVGGRTFKNTVFQQPYQIEGTRCGPPNLRLLKALQRASRDGAAPWAAIVGSLEVFLLAHSEAPELGWETSAMLSAVAFERLLEPPSGGAVSLAQAFDGLWAPYATLTLGHAKRAKPDPKWQVDQGAWPIGRKWMKELYEVRSLVNHSRAERNGFSRNWRAAQHVVIAAFVYPLAIKLRLSAGGLYQLDDEELGACEALDAILDSDWGNGWRRDPEWPSILRESRHRRAWSRLWDSMDLGGE